jgi:hypothetical protein
MPADLVVHPMDTAEFIRFSSFMLATNFYKIVFQYFICPLILINAGRIVARLIATKLGGEMIKFQRPGSRFDSSGSAC